MTFLPYMGGGNMSTILKDLVNKARSEETLLVIKILRDQIARMNLRDKIISEANTGKTSVVIHVVVLCGRELDITRIKDTLQSELHTFLGDISREVKLFSVSYSNPHIILSFSWY